jgi:hypothetical protein
MYVGITIEARAYLAIEQDSNTDKKLPNPIPIPTPMPMEEEKTQHAVSPDGG